MIALTREEAKRRIVALTISGGLDPDTPLSERSLAELTGIGRTPIREALHDLARDGIVTIEPKRGTFVRRLGLDDVREIFEVRFALEALAASLAALRGPTVRLREIDAALAPLDGSTLTDEEAALSKALGHELHLEIVRSSRNRLLQRQYSQVRLMIEVLLSMTERDETSRIQASIGEHLTISAAIIERDPVRAQTMMQRHLRAGHEIRMAILNDFPALTIAIDDATRAGDAAANL